MRKVGCLNPSHDRLKSCKSGSDSSTANPLATGVSVTGQSNPRVRGNELQSERTSCPIRGNELQSERTSYPIRGNELLIHENGLHNSI